MKKKNVYIFLSIIIIIVLVVIAFYIYKNNNDKKIKLNQENFNTERLATEINVNNEKKQNEETQNTETQNAEIEYKKAHPTETELSSYSSPLKAKASGRLNNIRISCNKLNGTVIAKGKSFSFNEIIGKPTADKGYKEADVFENGKTVKALGGGNCQVSSTLYNAVLAVHGLTVTERHEHGKDVTYVPDGKDAAVSYGVMDLKFKNETNDDIKIYLSSDDVNVSSKISKLTY